jgi:hypothetical protein
MDSVIRRTSFKIGWLGFPLGEICGQLSVIETRACNIMPTFFMLRLAFLTFAVH